MLNTRISSNSSSWCSVKKCPACPAHKLFTVANFIMFKENPSNVDPLYCLSDIIGTRNTAAVVIITMVTTIITCLSNCRQSAGAFCYKYNRWSCIFSPAFLGVGGEADVPRCDSAVHRVYRRPLALSHRVSVETACDWPHLLLIPNIPSCGKYTRVVTIHINAHFSF